MIFANIENNFSIYIKIMMKIVNEWHAGFKAAFYFHNNMATVKFIKSWRECQEKCPAPKYWRKECVWKTIDQASATFLGSR